MSAKGKDYNGETIFNHLHKKRMFIERGYHSGMEIAFWLEDGMAGWKTIKYFSFKHLDAGLKPSNRNPQKFTLIHITAALSFIPLIYNMLQRIWSCHYLWTTQKHSKLSL